MRNRSILFILALLLGASSFLARRATAYDSYDPVGVGVVGCVDCHDGFVKRGPLHDMHVGNQQMTANCSLCHVSTGDNPQTWTSGETGGQGCRGCHGIDNGTEFGWGVGLRLHHANAGAPADANGQHCFDCHTDNFSPAPENAFPVYYARSDVNVKSPCDSQSATGEDWDADGAGLDNDGDLVYDEADGNCLEVTAIADPGGIGPRSLLLAPNPVRQADVTVGFHLAEAGSFNVALYDVAGRLRYATAGTGQAGWQEFSLPVERLSLRPGVYVLRVESVDGVRTGKLAVVS